MTKDIVTMKDSKRSNWRLEQSTTGAYSIYIFFVNIFCAYVYPISTDVAYARISGKTT